MSRSTPRRRSPPQRQRPVPVGQATSPAIASPGAATASSTWPYRIAITQMRIDDRGRAYLEHRRAVGDTKTEAIRALRQEDQ